MKFKHHKYTWSKPYGSVNHKWEVVGPTGAIHFHVSIVRDTKYPPSAGLEFHHTSGDGAPDHLTCPLTGGRCWHDGTSLYATEQIWPIVKMSLEDGDQEAVFRLLEGEYAKHFDEGEMTVMGALAALSKEPAP